MMAPALSVREHPSPHDHDARGTYHPPQVTSLLRRDRLMEPLLVLGAFIALAVLALRFGQDSRQGAVSAEEILGRQGVRGDLQVADDPATSVNSLPARARGLATLWC